MPRTVSVKLLADVAQFTREIGGRSVTAVKSLAGELDKAAQAGKLDHVANSLGGLGLGLVGAAGAAVKMSMDFEKSMSAVSAATHAPAADLEKLRKAAIRAGADTQFSATGAADAITELSKAGVSTADVLGGGLKGALDLAAAGQLDVSEAAETAASAMTQFKLQGKDIPHIADLLAAGAGKAQGSVHDMGYALNQSGLVASQFGLSIEDTTGALAQFANAGLIGSDAGTSFKTMLLAIANPSKITSELMHELDISFYNAQGQFIGLSGVADVLRSRLGSLTDEQRQQALGQIFGNDAIRAATVLYKDGSEGVKKWASAVNDAGYANETAAKLTDNLAGDLERLRGSLETVAIQAGGGANNGLRLLAQGANDAVDAFGSLPDWIQQTITVLSGVGGVSLLAGAGFIKVRGTAHDMMEQLRDIGPMGDRVATGLGKVTSFATKFGLVGTAIGLAFGGLELFSNWAEKRTAPVKANIDKLTESMQEFAATGLATGELAAKYGDSLQKIGQDVDAVTNGMADLKRLQDDVAAGLSDASLGENYVAIPPEAIQRLKDLDAALAQLVNNGGATQAHIMLERLAGSGKLTSQQFDTLMKQLPQYAAAAGTATTANSGMAKGFGDAEANTRTLTSAMDAAIDSGQTLTDVWKQLNGATLDYDRASLDTVEAIEAVKKSFQENGRAITGNSKAALENRVAVAEAAKAAAAAAQAKYVETGSVNEASKTYNSYIDQLRKTLGQSKLTKGQVDALIGAYAQMPSAKITKVDITGEQGVNKALDQLLVKQYALAKGLSMSAASASVQKDLDRNRQRAYDTGGWTGPGGKYDVAGIVHADEYVVNKASRNKLEARYPGMLDHANRFGDLPEWLVDATPGYALGGLVWPFPVNSSKSRIPSWDEVSKAVIPAVPGGGGGPGYRWMEQAIKGAFPGLHVISDYRPGARTLSGNLSYHGFGRAVDYPPSRALAQWIYNNYKARTKELITPYQDLNLHNGQKHTYTGAVWNQHNFAGGNAHDHWAMAGGGVIDEPVFGWGLRSGDTYSFGERGAETVTPGVGAGGGNTTVINVHTSLAAGANLREAGRQIAEQLQPYLAAGGSIVVRGQTVLGAG